MSDRRLVVISAGLSQPSSTRLLADRLAEATVAELAARGHTAQVEVVELRDLAHDVVDATLTGFPTGALADAIAAITAADGVIAVTPDLHRVLLRALQVVRRRARQGRARPACPCCSARPAARRGTPSRSTTRCARCSRYLHADVTGTSVFAATDDWAGAGGDQTNPLPERIRRAGRELAETVADREPAAPVGLYDAVPSFEQLLGGA